MLEVISGEKKDLSVSVKGDGGGGLVNLLGVFEELGFSLLLFHFRGVHDLGKVLDMRERFSGSEVID
jgi:hypothetical protein